MTLTDLTTEILRWITTLACLPHPPTSSEQSIEDITTTLLSLTLCCKATHRLLCGDRVWLETFLAKSLASYLGLGRPNCARTGTYGALAASIKAYGAGWEGNRKVLNRMSFIVRDQDHIKDLSFDRGHAGNVKDLVCSGDYVGSVPSVLEPATFNYILRPENIEDRTVTNCSFHDADTLGSHSRHAQYNARATSTTHTYHPSDTQFFTCPPVSHLKVFIAVGKSFRDDFEEDRNEAGPETEEEEERLRGAVVADFEVENAAGVTIHDVHIAFRDLLDKPLNQTGLHLLAEYYKFRYNIADALLEEPSSLREVLETTIEIFGMHEILEYTRGGKTAITFQDWQWGTTEQNLEIPGDQAGWYHYDFDPEEEEQYNQIPSYAYHLGDHDWDEERLEAYEREEHEREGYESDL